MIETRGLIGAIEAADTMIKAANVSVVKQEMVSGGIVTVLIEGDVGAVQAAVDAGKSTAEKLGVLLGAHVIPRADESVYKFIETNEQKKPSVKRVNSKITDEPRKS